MGNKKSTALTFVICNALYTMFCIARFVYTGSQVLIDVNRSAPVELSQNSLWYIIPQILYIFILAGVLWDLIIFNEKRWIRLSVILFILFKIASLMLIHFSDITYLLHNQYPFHIVNVGNLVTLLYILIALLLVRNEAIKHYLRWFVVFMILSLALPIIGETLYDDYGIHGFLISRDFMAELCFVPTLILFIRVYLLTGKNEPLSEK